EALIFQENGGVRKMSLDASNKPMLSPVGDMGFGVADATAVDSTFFALADRRGGMVRFVEMPSLRHSVTWRPTDSGEGKLFEPVAASAFGPLVAVADRGGGKVFVLDSYTLATVDSFDVEMPRDLAWGDSGELYALNEKGELYVRYPVGAASADVRTAAEGMKEAWSVSWADDGVIVASVSGRAWWSGRKKPGRSVAFGAVSLHDPWIEAQDGIETLMLRGSATSTFHDFIRDKVPVTQLVWRGEVRPSRVMSTGLGDAGAARFYSPPGGNLPDGGAITAVNSISEVMSDIAQMSRRGERIPGVIVLDSRISASDGELELFLAFLLQQGVRLDLWASEKPASLRLCRISRITLGRTYYTKNVEAATAGMEIEWVLGVPLPPDITTFGYPSDTTLSLFAEIDAIRFTDWLPIWPSLISRKEETGEGVEK
ncbi:MAG: hypothetical protein LBU26_06500, partial [Synergistaceae bacterium]|nr:hypothetical protein [Synergistaceae bacterium]